MGSPNLSIICHIIVFSISFAFRYSNGQSYSLHMYHKFSHEVKEWMVWKHGLDTDGWPTEGSNEYYKTLYHHDSARHGRKLTEHPPLTFSDGNETFILSQLGFLFYTVVQVGTPNVTLLVALDTGSDLFWVPCECQECAPTSSPSYGLDVALEIYSPSASKTSKPVACNNTLCDLQNQCSKSSDQCPYKVSYVSANTSTSGDLVEDILYLIPGDGSQNGTVVKAPITFGCGKVQTGSFLEGAAPNGLLGLGIESISVPTILHNSGFVSNSFSMCFPHNSTVGRFTFGDKGSSDQKESPFIIDQTHPTYYIGVKEFYVGNALVKRQFQALFDTGTSFTYLADPIYKSLTSNYHLQTQDSPLEVDQSGIPFEYCYNASNRQSVISQGRKISFNLNGGNNFSAIQPLVFLTDKNENLLGYCLAVLQSSSLTIIGQNFMTGYQLVFDREQSKLGWKEANCYDLDYSSSSASAPSSLTPLQSPLGPSSVGGSPNTSDVSSTGSSPKQSISPAALPVDPTATANDATHLSSFFLHIALSFIVAITILTVLL